jgi:hypothetical protein
MKGKNPAARESNRAENSEIQHFEFNPPTRAAQQISQRFGLSPVHAAVVAVLAGLGPREARTHGSH